MCQCGGSPLVYRMKCWWCNVAVFPFSSLLRNEPIPSTCEAEIYIYNIYIHSKERKRLRSDLWEFDSDVKNMEKTPQKDKYRNWFEPDIFVIKKFWEEMMWNISASCLTIIIDKILDFGMLIILFIFFNFTLKSQSKNF